MTKYTFVGYSLLILCLSVFNSDLSAQNSNGLVERKDSLIVSDTLIVSDSAKVTKSKFENPVIANAGDSIVILQKENKVRIYHSGEVIYDNINLKADFIEMDLNTNIVYAEGVMGDSGKIVGKPVFTEGKEKYEMTAMYYNFDTKKAIINGVITQQGDGYLVGERTKKMADNVFNIKGGKFTTCDHHDHPHFYIQLTKSKTIPNDKTISGPAYFVIEDIPLPIGVPFGFFPASKKRASGFLIPRFGEDGTKGFFLQNGGYYWAMSEYADLSLTGSYYTLGSYDFNLNSSYKLRYKFTGNIRATYLNTKFDDLAAEGQKSFRIVWSHKQDAKAHPTQNFSASVNFSMNNIDFYERQDPERYTNNRKTSTISYSKTFAGTPFSLTATMSHNSNTADSTIELNLPQIAFTMRQIYPFKRKVKVGETKWYEKIGFSYTSSAKNSVSTKESLLFEPGGTDGKWKNGLSHRIPISTSFNLFNYFNVGPAVNYNSYMYFKQNDQVWNDSLQVYEDTIVDGFSYAQEFSASVGVSTTIYGMYTFKEGMPIEAIRHKMDPSISLSYRPDFSTDYWGYYKPDLNDTTGISTYTTVNNPFLGYPGTGKSGNISFNLRNNIEMKVKNNADTTGKEKYKKIKILDALNFTSSYNLLADSLNLQPISISANTRIANFVSINFSASLDPYALDEDGTRINQFELIRNRNIGRITRATLNMDFSLKALLSGGKGSFTEDYINDLNDPYNLYYGSMYTENYVDFSVPWDLKVRYSLNYNKPKFEEKTTQALTLSGKISLTDKWQIGFSSGYDIDKSDFTRTSLTINRDLHCWAMSFNWIPFGAFKSYNFKINVKASMLQDIKYEKQERYY